MLYQPFGGAGISEHDLDAFLLEQIEEAALSGHDGQDVLPVLGAVMMHRDAAAFANISGGTDIIDRRHAASEGCREHPGCGFRRPRSGGRWEHLGASSE